MAKSHHTKIGEALEFLNTGLIPFVERELQAVYKNDWQEKAKDSLRNDRGAGKIAAKGNINWDTQNLLLVMWDQWNAVFSKTLGQSERSLVSELRNTRNDWAHQNPVSSDDAYRAMDSVERLLTAVGASDEAEEVKTRKDALLRQRFDEQRRYEAKKNTVAPTVGTPASNLKPWREIVTPHRDVASGNYQKAEFAADLWQVYCGDAASEYQDPTEFFRRTFLTDGLKKLLVNAVKRLNGKGGDPVVELQTNFGGGKTHSMLALYHLFSGVKTSELTGVEDILKEAEGKIADKVHRAVIVAPKLSISKPSKKKDGTVVHTIWGEIAWQLGGKEGYKLVKEDDENGTSPGDSLRELFNKYSPCLILIDEWVAYARNLKDDHSPAGTFDSQFTFAQQLSESAKAAKNTFLVVSIPASQNEIGGEWGQRALEILRNAMGRVASSWSPANPDESFEIVRRRLFEPMTDKQAFIDRDVVARAFVDMYGTQHNEFPTECREVDYERRIKMAYPIHPELFDKLYNVWSTLDKFQRTRGVLRLMATVIHSLWERQDNNLLIMPSTIPISDPTVQFELTRYLEEQWTPVITTDVDGENSLPLKLERDLPNLGRCSACRRVARTVYIGSAPTLHLPNRGIDDKSVKLGCVQPGEAVATFGDAIRRLTDSATYLYVDGKRYWYSTQPTVTRLAEDRAAQVEEHDVMAEIHLRLEKEIKVRGEFSKIHISGQSSDIPDEREVRLVIVPPEYSYSKNHSGLAYQQVQDILANHGNSPRQYKNTLVFLAADTARLNDLSAAVKAYLAWKSIEQENETLNLDNFQKKQVKTKFDDAHKRVAAQIPETYVWLLVPEQSDPLGEMTWQETRLQKNDGLVLSVLKKLKNDEWLLTQLGDIRLRQELDKIPLWQGDSVSIKQLTEYFASYIYLPRLKDTSILVNAIKSGVHSLSWQETFAYAQSFDEKKKRYLGLIAGKPVAMLTADDIGLLVKPEVAQQQIESDKNATTKDTSSGASVISVNTTGKQPVKENTEKPAPPIHRRFHGSVSLDNIRIVNDTKRIADEVVQHLSQLEDAEVKITLEIQVKVPKGVPDDVIRDVSENCRTLHFDDYGFEKE